MTVGSAVTERYEGNVQKFELVRISLKHDGGSALEGRLIILAGRGFLAIFERGPQTTDTFSDSFTQFRQFLRSEPKEDNSKDHQQMCGLQ